MHALLELEAGPGGDDGTAPVAPRVQKLELSGSEHTVPEETAVAQRDHLFRKVLVPAARGGVADKVKASAVNRGIPRRGGAYREKCCQKKAQNEVHNQYRVHGSRSQN